ncbi:hypothetical protein CSB09_03675 [Candidatus Gracilibacteria bacterium]|nr:MAG: hypothetical protein CSB09_03675 [Candidatus Gracilibacteria bacterium]
MKQKIWYKILLGIAVLLTAGIAMTYSLRFDDYDNISRTFGTSAAGNLVTSSAIYIMIIAIGFFVFRIIPLQKIRALPPKKKFFVSLALFLFIFSSVVLVMVATLLFQVYIFDFFKP